jgi:hypothetical protein
LCDNCGDEGRKETLKLIDAAIGNDSSPATPTATASQESVPEQEADAINFILADGTHNVVAQRQLPQHAKLYLAPPTSTAIAAVMIRQAIKIAAKYRAGGAGSEFDFGYTSAANSIEEELRTLTPANAEAELEALMMKVAEEVQKATIKAGVFSTAPTPDERRAIVRRVLDEAKGEVK